MASPFKIHPTPVQRALHLSGTVLGTQSAPVNKTDRHPALVELMPQQRGWGRAVKLILFISNVVGGD